MLNYLKLLAVYLYSLYLDEIEVLIKRNRIVVILLLSLLYKIYFTFTCMVMSFSLSEQRT
jgi:hypothetical protein